MLWPVAVAGASDICLWMPSCAETFLTEDDKRTHSLSNCSQKFKTILPGRLDLFRWCARNSALDTFAIEPRTEPAVEVRRSVHCGLKCQTPEHTDHALRCRKRLLSARGCTSIIMYFVAAQTVSPAPHPLGRLIDINGTYPPTRSLRRTDRAGVLTRADSTVLQLSTRKIYWAPGTVKSP